MLKKRTSRRLFATFGFMLLALTVFGCASVKHVNTTDETLDLSKNSVLLLKLDTNNLINPIFKPRIEWLHLKNITTNKSYRVFIPSSGVDIGQSDRVLHWLAVYLPAGYYKIERIKGSASAILMNAEFDFPTTLNFNLPARSVSYAGTIALSLRELNPDIGEVRAGSILPLISQTASGFGKGTFDLALDSSQDDLRQFRLRKRALANAEIVTDTVTKP